MQTKNHENILFDAIYSSTREYLLKMCTENQVRYIFDTVSKNKEFLKSICLLPYWFYSCFEDNYIDLDNELFILSKANLQSTIAYTIYDYIRDKKIEKENINICLSVANILIQKSTNSFHDLVGFNKNKVNIIDGIINTMNTCYLDNKIISDIHYHFKYLCDNNYKKSIGLSINCLIVLWLLSDNKNHYNEIEVSTFFENYLNARQLSDDEDDMCDDMLNNIYTPATFLMRAQYSTDYIHSIIRSRIDTYMRSAVDSLKNISFFNYEKFIELYIKDC